MNLDLSPNTLSRMDASPGTRWRLRRFRNSSHNSPNRKPADSIISRSSETQQHQLNKIQDIDSMRIEMKSKSSASGKYSSCKHIRDCLNSFKFALTNRR